MQYAEVLLPLPVEAPFTYRVPPDMAPALRPGQRVLVPFGRKKFYTGILLGPAVEPPAGCEIKDIIRLLDEEPVVRHPQLKLWHWLADYYLCTPGEVYRAAVPAGLKIESETFVTAAPDWEEDPDSRLSEREAVVMEILLSREKRISVDALAREAGITHAAPVVARLMARGAVIISENLVERYRAKRIPCVAINADRSSDSALRTLFDAVRPGSPRERALLALLDLSGFTRRDLPEPREVTRAELLDRSGVTTSVLAAMEKKGIIRRYVKEVGRFDYSGLVSGELPALTPAQQTALDAIIASWLQGPPVTLLRGVTSSGKTEIYIHLIDRILRQDLQALMLVPEIALTTQLTSRLQRVFGPKVVIYHSKFSDNERVDIWRRLLRSSEPCVVIGARSAVFLPFARLGLVIVDEEHESAYKQQDPAPRYNGRDAAMVLASMHGAKTLLGSATPSVETYFKASSGRYGLVELTERFEGMQLPQVEIIDMAAARRKGEVAGPFARATHTLVADAVGRGEQAILFLNRRGYAPVARCRLCGHVPKCTQCDVSLTYHRRSDKLICHYCGTPYAVPDVCPACREPGIEVLGYGTERIEEEVEAAFPDVPMGRLDLDTTRSKDDYEKIIEAFSKGRTRILVGTQMVTKGLDFDRVSVVGVVNADAILHFPDFRSSERAFCMLEQVAGRAGRRISGGRVAVQTYSPSHPIFPFLLAHDYMGFYRYEIEERRRFAYPPFSRVIYIVLRHKDQAAVSAAAFEMARRLRELLGNRVSGPEEPYVARVQNLYIRRIMLKIETGASLVKVKQLLREIRISMSAARLLSGIMLHADVDPS